MFIIIIFENGNVVIKIVTFGVFVFTDFNLEAARHNDSLEKRTRSGN